MACRLATKFSELKQSFSFIQTWNGGKKKGMSSTAQWVTTQALETDKMDILSQTYLEGSEEVLHEHNDCYPYHVTLSYPPPYPYTIY